MYIYQKELSMSEKNWKSDLGIYESLSLAIYQVTFCLTL